MGPLNIESILIHSLYGAIPFLTTYNISPPTNNITGTINGYINVIVKNTVIVLKVVKEASPKDPGKTWSNTEISLENLVKILPTGFESKNKI